MGTITIGTLSTAASGVTTVQNTIASSKFIIGDSSYFIDDIYNQLNTITNILPKIISLSGLAAYHQLQLDAINTKLSIVPPSGPAY